METRMLKRIVILLLSVSAVSAAEFGPAQAAGGRGPAASGAAQRAPGQKAAAHAETRRQGQATANDAKPAVLANDRPVGPLAWRPGSRVIAGATIQFTEADGFVSGVRLWDVENKNILLTLREEKKVRYPAIAFSPDGKLLAIAVQPSADRASVRLVDSGTGATRSTIPHQGWVRSVVFSHDGKYLAIGGQDRPQETTGPFPRTILLWDLAHQRVEREFRENLSLDDLQKSGTADGLRELVFSPDDTLMASADVDFRVRLIEVATGRVRHTLEGHTEVVLGLAFSPDGKTLTTGGFDGTVRVWDVQTGKPLRTLKGNQGQVWKVAATADGQFVAAAGTIVAAGKRRSEATLWNTRSWRPTSVPLSEVAEYGGLAFSPDGQTLAVSGATRENAGAIELWRVSDLSGQQPRTGAGEGR